MNKKYSTDEIMARLKASRIFLATPAYGGIINVETAQSIMRAALFFQQNGLQFTFQSLVNESLVTRARNTMVRQFLNSDATHLLFVDADIQFTVDDILAVFMHDEGVVCGLYAKKSVPTDYVINALPDYDYKNHVGALLPVKHAGTGFMMIKREAIERMIRFYKEVVTYKSDNPATRGEEMYALFDVKIVGDTYLSEDYLFCHRWRTIGEKVYVDQRVKLPHIGHYVFGEATDNEIRQKMLGGVTEAVKTEVKPEAEAEAAPKVKPKPKRSRKSATSAA